MVPELFLQPCRQPALPSLTATSMSLCSELDSVSPGTQRDNDSHLLLGEGNVSIPCIIFSPLFCQFEDLKNEEKKQ